MKNKISTWKFLIILFNFLSVIMYFAFTHSLDNAVNCLTWQSQTGQIIVENSLLYRNIDINNLYIVSFAGAVLCFVINIYVNLMYILVHNKN
jgi:hypothetical protein